MHVREQLFVDPSSSVLTWCRVAAPRPVAAPSGQVTGRIFRIEPPGRTTYYLNVLSLRLKWQKVDPLMSNWRRDRPVSTRHANARSLRRSSAAFRFLTTGPSGLPSRLHSNRIYGNVFQRASARARAPGWWITVRSSRFRTRWDVWSGDRGKVRAPYSNPTSITGKVPLNSVTSTSPSDMATSRASWR